VHIGRFSSNVPLIILQTSGDNTRQGTTVGGHSLSMQRCLRTNNGNYSAIFISQSNSALSLLALLSTYFSLIILASPFSKSTTNQKRETKLIRAGQDWNQAELQRKSSGYLLTYIIPNRQPTETTSSVCNLKQIIFLSESAWLWRYYSYMSVPSSCASCGVAENDDIKSTKCNACDLALYCSDACQELHRPEHELACKKRTAEILDELLFKQPESTHLGDCPICLLPFSTNTETVKMMACCSKSICHGCDYAIYLYETEQSLEPTCSFCRHPIPETLEGVDLNLNVKKRLAVDDPVAIRQMGLICINTVEGTGDERFYSKAVEYLTKAAELGDAQAHYQRSIFYQNGQAVEKDEEKELYHLEEAAIGGHPDARYNLGCIEAIIGRFDRAVKHFIIAANLGEVDSLKALRQCYVDGYINKEDFAAALRAYQTAVDATKSPQREAAEARRNAYQNTDS
jgi:tetratricopeptide (TPR) repeat protein